MCPFAPEPRTRGFTLIELLLVMALIVLVEALAVPAIQSLSENSDMTQSAYRIGGAIESARSYAMANNTYTWVGFYEEAATASAPTAKSPPYTGCGRVLVGIVTSKDGTELFNTTDTPETLTVAKLVQVQKLIKIPNLHLADIGTPNGNSTPLDSRPSLPYNTSQSRISSESSDATSFPFTIQGYTFYKTIRFNPRGEANVNSTYDLRPLIEIGLKPTHGTSVDSNSKNLVAIQITGIGGNMRIYRR